MAGEERMSGKPPRPAGQREDRNFAALRAEVARLRQELEATKATLGRAEQGGSDPQVARRLAELEEGQKVARGLAGEAALARARTKAELRELRDAIGKTPGVHGWLLRRELRPNLNSAGPQLAEFAATIQLARHLW